VSGRYTAEEEEVRNDFDSPHRETLMQRAVAAAASIFVREPTREERDTWEEREQRRRERRIRSP